MGNRTKKCNKCGMIKDVINVIKKYTRNVNDAIIKN